MPEKEKLTLSKKSVDLAASSKGRHRRDSDITLGWVIREYPQLASWHALALEWLQGETRGVPSRLKALGTFFEKYIVEQHLPVDPAVLLARTTALPDFYETACPRSTIGTGWNNRIRSFIEFVLLRNFSEAADDGQPVVSPAFRNPVPWIKKSGLPRRDESVHSPLPYGYIDELRQILAPGPHFRDWQWAQDALGAEVGARGTPAPDWFEVSEQQIDRNDPDCVWRVREYASPTYRGGARFELWSPVRWVALLTKLILPLRTYQVRMLDSGEADTWRYVHGNWQLNSGKLAHRDERRPLAQGVFRRSTPLVESEAVSTLLYVNTNKTGDLANSGQEMGYLLPWSFGGPVHQDVFYWLEKLRNWQEKYNPLRRRTRWTELDGRHMVAKSEVQLASYPDTCFLFRLPERPERHLPLTESSMNRGWFELLKTLELRLAARAETHPNGTPVRLLSLTEEPATNKGPTSLFPLHCLRVSLITALALDGQVPFAILQKLVGHSRLLMTLYYTKPGASHVREVLMNAAERLKTAREASIQNFLLDTEHEQLLQKAICNSVPSLAAAIPRHPAARNPVGWMPLHHGLCLVGGNTSETEDNASVGGCYNGGPIIVPSNSPTHRKYGAVPGGSRNCVRCRWFVTEPHYLPALAGHFNTLAYHFDEARNLCLSREQEVQRLKKERADAEEASLHFPQLEHYRQAERLWESAMKRFSDLAEDLVACWRLIERCKEAFEGTRKDGMQLLAAGSIEDVRVAFEETESELLQLSEVCENVEIFPDLDPGKAVFRRSQLLDAVLYRDDLMPVFMTLTEEEQLRSGNAFLRRLAQKMNPTAPVLGRRQVIRLIDAGVSLGEYFGMDLASLMPSSGRAIAVRRDALSAGEV